MPDNSLGLEDLGVFRGDGRDYRNVSAIRDAVRGRHVGVAPIEDRTGSRDPPPVWVVLSEDQPRGEHWKEVHKGRSSQLPDSPPESLLPGGFGGGSHPCVDELLYIDPVPPAVQRQGHR